MFYNQTHKAILSVLDNLPLLPYNSTPQKQREIMNAGFSVFRAIEALEYDYESGFLDISSVSHYHVLNQVDYFTNLFRG